jgi:hypothetical protein
MMEWFVFYDSAGNVIEMHEHAGDNVSPFRHATFTIRNLTLAVPWIIDCSTMGVTIVSFESALGDLVLRTDANEIISHSHLSDRQCCLKRLTEYIAQQLKERGICVVFDRDLERCWPSSGMSREERERKIQDFAESQGGNAAILEAGSGTRTIFQKPEPSIIAASI